MTTQLKRTLSELVQMAREGNRHAVPTLNQILAVTSDRKDRQQVKLAISKASGTAPTGLTEAEATAVIDDLTSAPAKPAPSYLDTFFGFDAETARRFELAKAAVGR